jgi:hypothetical protein
MDANPGQDGFFIFSKPQKGAQSRAKAGLCPVVKRIQSICDTGANFFKAFCEKTAAQ